MGSKKREIDEGRRRKEICGEWQRVLEGSGETEIDIAGHEGKEKEIDESGWHKGR